MTHKIVQFEGWRFYNRPIALSSPIRALSLILPLNVFTFSSSLSFFGPVLLFLPYPYLLLQYRGYVIQLAHGHLGPIIWITDNRDCSR